MSDILEPRPTLPPVTATPMASASLTLGLISLIAWLIPIIGIPLSVTGIILGICALAKYGYSGKATAAIVLATVTLFAGVINSFVGAEQGYRAGMCSAGNYSYCDRY